MINSITIKNVATFDKEGVVIDNLKKVNFIYGTNGSGKTTISNLLKNPLDGKFSSCSINWEKDSVLSVLVYNKQFREENFGKGKIPGVFTLGQATKDQIEEIEKMKAELNVIKESGKQKKETIEKQKESKSRSILTFQDNCWVSIYKKYENTFKGAFQGVSNAKKAFADKIISQYHNNTVLIKTLEELKEKAKTIFGETPQILNEINVFNHTQLLEIETNQIWTKKIIGKSDIDIAKLIQRLNINDWVNQGKKHIEIDSDICPFCQKHTIDENFKKQLNDYFDESFTTEIAQVKQLAEQYFSMSQNLLNTLQAIENEVKTNKNTKLNLQLFEAYLKTLTEQINSNKEYLNNKQKEPSRSIELISIKEQLENITNLIVNANEEIKKHNLIVANYQTEKKDLISDVWRFLVDENRTSIETFIRKENGLQTGIDNLEKERTKLLTEYQQLDAKIKNANKNVTSVQASVDEINRMLVAYGFTNFKIAPFENNQYQIKRENGEIAENTLSEGEVTFITFLYFLQMTKGSASAEKANEDRIVVIDDPISSLDSTILFVVSSAIKEIVKSIKNRKTNIKQIIVLTHNVFFHKEVSFIDGRTKKCKDTHFWILRKKDNCSIIQAFQQENTIKNSYELLWQEVDNQEYNSSVAIQNTMRRILETYFKTMGKFTDDNLINCFKTKEEQEICRSLLSWTNDGSHCMPDDLYIEEQGEIIDKYSDVFKNIFENMGHIEHYNMMMKISTEEQA